MGTGRSSLWSRMGGDEGFTIIEAMVAVTVLSIAIVLSIQPVITSLRGVSDARVISVSENLAQAEVEIIRSLDYEQIGLPGRTPSGSLVETRSIEVEGREYTIDVSVEYAGSVTGLAVIPQGGDGVEGAWDPGVDYKVARVAVTADGREFDPIVMETIIAPTRVGQHEGIANVKVLLAAHEPFAESGLDLPSLKVYSPPNPELRSGVSASEQVWPAVPVGTYTVLVDNPNGWVIHPQDVIDGLDQVEALAGQTAETTLRVYRPATFIIEVFDFYSREAMGEARLTLTNLESGTPTAYVTGQYTVENLMPDAYGVTITADGYHDWTLSSLNIPANYPEPEHTLTVYMEPLVLPTTTTTTTTVATTTTTDPTGEGSTTTTSSTSTTTTTTQPAAPRIPVEFVVIDNRNIVVAGATVEVVHDTDGDGPFSGVTDAYGRITFNLIDGATYWATGSTKWGHSPDTDRVDVGGWIDALELGRPSGKGNMKLQGGSDAEFLYRPTTSAPWKVMPANYQNLATFVAYQGWYQVAKRCVANGEVEGTKWIYVRGNKNRTTTINGWCPG